MPRACSSCDSRNVDRICLRCGGSVKDVTGDQGWYPAEDDPTRERFWDGISWSAESRVGELTSDGRAIDTPDPGWLADPSQAGLERWWDGRAWTQTTRRAPSGLAKVPWRKVSTAIILILALVMGTSYWAFLRVPPKPAMTSCAEVNDSLVPLSIEIFGGSSPDQLAQGDVTQQVEFGDLTRDQQDQISYSLGQAPALVCTGTGVRPDGSTTSVVVAVDNSSGRAVVAMLVEPTVST